jgi:hypothetical protein
VVQFASHELAGSSRNKFDRDAERAAQIRNGADEQVVEKGFVKTGRDRRVAAVDVVEERDETRPKQRGRGRLPNQTFSSHLPPTSIA